MTHIFSNVSVVKIYIFSRNCR